MPLGDVAALANTATVSGPHRADRLGQPQRHDPGADEAAGGRRCDRSRPGRSSGPTAGTGANQIRQIIAESGYGTDVVAVSRNWGTVPDNTTTYKILQGMMFEISPNAVDRGHLGVRCFSTSAADVPSGSTRYLLREGLRRQQQHRDGADRGADRGRERNPIAAERRGPRSRACRLARRQRNDRQPADRTRRHLPSRPSRPLSRCRVPATCRRARRRTPPAPRACGCG